jgi:hypothetical protein
MMEANGAQGGLTAASTLAGLSGFGSASRLMTDRRILLTLCTGDQLLNGKWGGGLSREGVELGAA